MYFLSKLAIALISPLGSALLLGVLAIVLASLGRRRIALGLGVVAVLWLWVWSLPIASVGLRAMLESEFPPRSASEMPMAHAVVVLGGCMAPADRLHPQSDLKNGADRLRFAAQLYHAGKAPLLVLSGGADRDVSLTSEAEAMREFMRELGVPEDALVLEEDSRNTAENARHTAALLRKRGVRHVLLVTSAMHMARALHYFRAENLGVTPAAADYEAHAVSGWQQWVPDADALYGSARALKEWVGQRMLSLS